jgi:signal transduction histidine kinase
VSNPTILVVESDSTLLNTITEKILKPNGFNILATQNPDDGLRMATAARPDLLLLHIPIPEAEIILAKVAGARKPIPTVLVVEQSTIQIGVNLLRLGVKEFVTWPPVAEDLLHAVNRTLEQTKPSSANGLHTSFEFADMISHLTRNPLNIIQTSTQCLRTLDLSPEEQRNLQDKIWQQSQRLTSFTNELLRMLRMETEGGSVCAVPVRLVPVIEKLLDGLDQEKPDLTIQFIAPQQEIPPVTADATKTELIILSLVKGAIRRCSAGCEIKISLWVTDTEVIITIEDNGMPIPIEPLNNIFKPYYAPGKSRLNVPSTYHLGLYTTKKWIELQKGRIWAEAPTGGGSQFHFSVPIRESDA